MRRNLRARRTGPSLNVDEMLGGISGDSSDGAPDSDNSDGGDSDFDGEQGGTADHKEVGEAEAAEEVRHSARHKSDFRS